MIEYVKVHRKSDREIIGIIDNAKSIIWHSVYYGVGDFEIYAIANSKHIELLQEGNYITRPDDNSVGVIESIQTENSAQNGTMIIASGRFAKSILDRRQIYNLNGKVNTPTILSGKVESAARALVANNAISCSFDVLRNISFLELGTLKNYPEIIVDEYGSATQKQVSYKNLLEYSDGLLQEYELGAEITLNEATNKLQYSVYKGEDRSADNTDGNDPIVFSQEYDNLLESSYKVNTTTKKTSALVGGQGEGLERFYSVIKGTESGLERREMWVDASSINKKYKDEDDQEQEYTDAEYKAMLDAQGKQALSSAITEESYGGTININGGIYRLNEDYFLGDIVTFQDNKLGKFANVRIVELSEVQDENGYNITPVFEFKLEDVELLQVLSTENMRPLTTETNAMLSPERRTLSSPLLTSNPSKPEIETVPISELPASEDLYDGCCVPVVTNGETKKFTFALLKQKILGLFGDYVVEQGTSGDWTYRKWNSGLAECFYRKNEGSIAITTAYGSLYYHNIAAINYPFSFISPPYVHAAIEGQGGDPFTTFSANGTKAKTPTITVYAPSSGTKTVILNIEAKGKWK